MRYSRNWGKEAQGRPRLERPQALLQKSTGLVLGTGMLNAPWMIEAGGDRHGVDRTDRQRPVSVFHLSFDCIGWKTILKSRPKDEDESWREGIIIPHPFEASNMTFSSSPHRRTG